jgi:hypothetical protein
VNWADAGGADAPERGAPPGLGFDGRLALGGFGAFGATSLLAAEPPLCPGRDRLINFHRPPSGADAPPPFDDDTRKEPEWVLQGCQPLGTEAARDDEPAIASAPAGAALSGPGTNAPAEFRAYALAPLPDPPRLPAFASDAAASELCPPHIKQAVGGLHTSHRMAAVAAAVVATASTARMSTSRLRCNTGGTSADVAAEDLPMRRR